MDAFTQLQEQLFAEDVAYGQQQSQAEMSALKGLNPDWVNIGSSLLSSMLSRNNSSTSSSVAYSSPSISMNNSGWASGPRAAAKGGNLTSSALPLLPWYVYVIAGLVVVTWARNSK